DSITALSSGATHHHYISIPLADVMAGVTKTFQSDMMMDNTGHAHAIELTVADFATLQAGGVVSKVTCDGGDHIFQLQCGMHTELGTSPLPMQCGEQTCGSVNGSPCPDSQM